MRLLFTVASNEAESLANFSYFLQSKNIDNHIEKVHSSIGDPPTYELWITDEDQIRDALLFYEEYQKNPNHKRYKQHILPSNEEAKEEVGSIFPSRSYGPVTMTILLAVILLFFWSQATREREYPPPLKGVIQTPLLSPIEKNLLYDYPYYFQLRDKLFTLWPVKELREKVPPSQEAVTLLQEMKERTVWMGFYDRILAHKRNSSVTPMPPLFEKMREGEVWRLLTPTFLHLDLLHIFFNVLWLIILSNQIESRIGSGRTLLFVLLTGIPSNTAQYLMSGPFFMGLSGVICAMAAFIWARQQIAPWEGYLVQRFTLIFLAIFVMGMFLLSFIFFILQYYFGMVFTAVIANTAHIVGALIGYLLGRTRLFASHL